MPDLLGQRTISIGVLLLSLSATAEASSFVTLAPPKPGASSSFVVLGEPAAAPVAVARIEDEPDAVQDDILAGLPVPVYPSTAPAIRQISASIIAMGAPMPAVTFEQVAAVAPNKRVRPQDEPPLPLVIRGGIIGDQPLAITAAPTSPAAPARTTPKAQQQASGGKPAAAQSSGSNRRPEPPAPAAPDQPAPAPPPPSAPKMRGLE